MAKTRVMIVDDQQLARQLFNLYIEGSGRYEVVNLAETAAFAEAAVSAVPVDLIVMDILMKDESNGLEAAAAIKKLHPDIKILAVTSMAEASWLKTARAAGIESFWYKDSSQETILEVMDRTMAGESVYPDSPPVIRIGLCNNTELTERELDVLRYMTKGLPNSVIAKKLNVSENTVKTHIQHMLNKTGFENRTELAIEARLSGVAVSLEK